KQKQAAFARTGSLAPWQLTRSRWSIQKHSFPRREQSCEELRESEWHDDRLLQQLLGLLQLGDVGPAHVGIGAEDVARDHLRKLPELRIGVLGHGLEQTSLEVGRVIGAATAAACRRAVILGSVAAGGGWSGSATRLGLRRSASGSWGDGNTCARGCS